MAVEILATPEGDLEGNALKVRLLCYLDLRQAALFGTLGRLLFATLHGLGSLMHGDIQPLEGNTNTIKIMATRNPSMSLPLLSSRTVVKYHCSRMGTATQEDKASIAAIL